MYKKIIQMVVKYVFFILLLADIADSLINRSDVYVLQAEPKQWSYRNFAALKFGDVMTNVESYISCSNVYSKIL